MTVRSLVDRARSLLARPTQEKAEGMLEAIYRRRTADLTLAALRGEDAQVADWIAHFVRLALELDQEDATRRILAAAVAGKFPAEPPAPATGRPAYDAAMQAVQDAVRAHAGDWHGALPADSWARHAATLAELLPEHQRASLDADGFVAMARLLR